MPKKSARLLGLYCSLFLYLFGASAQAADSHIESMRVVNKFGVPIMETGARATEFLGLHADVVYPQGSIRDLGAGDTLFIQENDTLISWFPKARGSFIALSNSAGYINVFAGSNLYPDINLPGDLKFEFSLFDRGRMSWVNPAFFIKGIQDTFGPQITSLALEKGGLEYEFKDSSSSKKPFPQGTYSIVASILDERQKQSSSGLIRIKIALDGVSLIDNKLDVAIATTEGLSFLGYPAPSARILGKKSRLIIGELKLLRGEHTLEISAYDFVGNETVVRWKLRIE